MQINNLRACKYLKRILKNYSPILSLLGGIALGGFLGIFAPQSIIKVKPVGDIFLNLLLTAVIPLVFFSVSSSIASLGSSRTISRLIGSMILVFSGTVLFAAIVAVLTLHFFPISINYSAAGLLPLRNTPVAGNPLVDALTVNDFPEILSRSSVLPLITFSFLIGIATRRAGSPSQTFKTFLASGNAVMKSLLQLIMKVAPLGLGVYFGCQLASAGTPLLKNYTHVLIAAHLISIAYFALAFSGYAFIAGGLSTVRRYWKNNVFPSATALATCSSVAAIPSNLEAAERMGIPPNVGEVSIPMGAILHKEGSAIVTVVGISVIGKGFGSIDACLMALIISVLVAIIEGGVPNGGYTGQLLIMSVYHFPAEVWPIIVIISTLLDPIATLLNVAGDTASALLITRLLRIRQNTFATI